MAAKTITKNTNMQTSQALQIAERKPRELTVREVMKVVEGLGENGLHAIDVLCPDAGVPAEALAISIDCTTDELLELAPSVAVRLIGECKAKNGFLIEAIEKLAAVGRSLEEQRAESNQSVEQSAP